MTRTICLLALTVLIGCAQTVDSHDESPRAEPERPARQRPAEVLEPKGELALTEVIRLTLTQHPALVPLGLERRARNALRLQASLLPNPELEFEVEEFGGRSELRGFDGAEYSLIASQRIELGGKRARRTRLASRHRDLADWELRSKRLDLIRQATLAFVRVLELQDRVALDQEFLSLAQKVAKAADARLRAGKASSVEQQRTQLALETSKLQLASSQALLLGARSRLATSWGRTTARFERASGSLQQLTSVPPLGGLVARLAGSADLRRWGGEISKREAALSLERAMRVPDLTVAGGARYFRELDETAFVLGVSLPLPLFDRNQGGIREARTRLAQTEARQAAAESRAQAALLAAYQELSAAHASATALKNQILPRAQALFAAARAGYRQGKFRLFEVLDAQRALFEARGRHLASLSSYHKAAVDLERAVGGPLSESHWRAAGRKIRRTR